VADSVSYSHARQNLAKVLSVAEETREPVIIKRRGHEDMALIPAEELRALEETVHLLRSPKNAQRIFRSLQRALDQEGEPQSPAELRSELGVD
jgi:antitoxin YefM